MAGKEVAGVGRRGASSGSLPSGGVGWGVVVVLVLVALAGAAEAESIGVTGLIPVSPTFGSNPVWSPDGNSVLFLAETERDTPLALRKSEYPPHVIERRIFIASYSKDMGAFESPRSIDVTEGPFYVEEAAWSPDGKRLFVTGTGGKATDLPQREDQALYELAPRENYSLFYYVDVKRIASSPTGGSMRQLKVLQNGDIYFRSLKIGDLLGEVWKYRNGNLTQLYNGAFKYGVSSNGDKAAFLDESGRIGVLEKNQTIPSWLETKTRPTNILLISPDGKQILINHEKRDRNYKLLSSELWLVDINTLNETRLTVEKGPYGDPAWSPDGTKVVYSFGELRLINITTGKKSSLGRVSGAQSAWSPSGDRIVFTDSGGVWVLTLSSEMPVQSSETPVQSAQPTPRQPSFEFYAAISAIALALWARRRRYGK